MIITDVNNNPISNFTYIRVNIRVFPSSELVKIYINLSTERNLIRKDFLKSLKYIIKEQYARIKGVGNKSIYII